MTSSIYTGHVMHQRLAPKPHRFDHAFYFYAIDLDELGTLDKELTGFGYNRFCPVAIHDKDYLDATSDPIPVKLKRWLEKHGYATDFKRVRMVTSPRFFNYVFNPVSFYLCYGEEDRLEYLVAEVNNTFRERHVYIVDRLQPVNGHWAMERHHPKEFHVSPFNDMDGEYAMQVTDTDKELDIRVDIFKKGSAVFLSQLQGLARPLTSGSMWGTVARYPLRAALTFPRILWEAGRLFFRKHLKVFQKPVPVHADTISVRPPSLIQRLAMKVVMKVFAGIREGRLRLILPNGLEHTFGDENSTDEGVIRVRNYRFFTRMVTGGSVGFGEGFVDQYWQSDDPAAALAPLAANLESVRKGDGPLSKVSRWANRLYHVGRRNTRRTSRKNIQEHYDLGNDFYETFLDPTMTYSSGIYLREDDSLEQSQYNKLDAMIRKADIRQEHHVLEIGSGWGSCAIRAAKTTGCRVTSITLSDEQHRLATERVKAAGLEDRVEIRICDYRDIEGSYDRILSIEMLEAVGHEFMGEYFARCRQLLKPDGRLVIQVITIPDARYEAYRTGCDWIQKYIFPGGHLPSPGAIRETSGPSFTIEDTEDIGLDYARTLREWREQFVANLARVRELGYDETFIRKWVYYLAYCEAGFAAKKINDLQIVLSPSSGA